MEKNLSQKIGKRLKLLRIEKDLKQSELAEILKVTKSNISKYERGDVEINFETMVTLSDLFDVSIDYLYCKTELRKESDKEDIPSEYLAFNKEALKEGMTVEEIKKAIEHYKEMYIKFNKEKKKDHKKKDL